MLGDLAPVCDAREKWGAIDVSGEAVIAPAYDGLYGFADAVAAFNVGGTNLNGVATMGGKWGIIDAEGTEVCAPRFDMLTGFSDGIASGTEQGCAVIVDRAGEVRWRGPQGASLLPPWRGRAWLHSGPIEGHHLLDTPSMEVI